ncbi:MAG TPA: tRNA (adenosine(37)-N6)-threonylcarbamoyltransferase complex ATPase subunit type 1 TsaE, partial [Spirochaetia bacterium]|nr:tRNA (adenosine(37)-N6)-threonylcarbamoyltransferase complex ATPase subunit type 1 TsaE [Spirochaetia bacterium]
MGEELAVLSDGSVLILIGPLGAGKTVLAKGIALGLGVQEPVVSPTYTIV